MLNTKAALGGVTRTRVRIAIVVMGALTVGVVAIGAVVGYETYYACVNNSSGTIKVVGGAEDCNSGDYFIEWNAQGPQGEVGPQGENGPAGPQGAIGPQGETGLTGAVGPQGETGPVGPQGENGPAGPQGAIGPQGETGLTGAVGPQGENGAQGTPGTSGANGMSGYEVVTASTGTDLVIAECPAGKVPVGGGGTVPFGADIFQSKPTATGWLIQGESDDEVIDAWTVTAYAICAFTD